MTSHRPELKVFVLWERILGDLLDRTARFPKAIRFTLTSRIDNAALDILEALVEARYSTGRAREAQLGHIDRRLARLRVLMRLAHERGHLSHGGFEHMMRGVDEAGRMIGGWRKASVGPV